MKERITASGGIEGHCPECNDTRVFVNKAEAQRNTAEKQFSGYLLTCPGCHRPAFALTERDNGKGSIRLAEFHPPFEENARIPDCVPDELVTEFREAERCAAAGAYRAASAMLRSCLEKVLNRNGYTKDELEKEDVKPDLYHRIELAAKDGVITAARRKRAHSNVRVLGNDILHEDWKPVEREAYEDSHHYTVRILEDFYDDRETVETLLKGKRRISDDVEPDRA